MSNSDPTPKNQALSPFRSSVALFLFFGITAIGLAVDLATKVIAFQRLVLSEYQTTDGHTIVQSRDWQVIPNILHFHATTNHGAVFGLGQGKRWLFVVVSLAAIAFLTYLFSQSGRQRLYQLILGLLLAGVLGNMYDRVVYGYVRDMLYAFPGWKWSAIFGQPASSGDWRNNEVFPWIFNVADSMLCVGVFLMILFSLFSKTENAAVEQLTDAK